MRKSGKMQFLYDLIFQDVKNENEAKRTALIIRLFTMTMWVYFIALLLLFIVRGEGIVIVGTSIPFMLLYLGAFYETYNDRTKLAVYMVNGITVLWSCIMVYALGWDCGVQLFIFVLMMLMFMTYQAGTWRKVCYAAVLCVIRMLMFLYAQDNQPKYIMPPGMGIVLQYINTITICLLIVVSMFLYSRNSAEMELKLVAYNEKLQKMAATDPLTGLGNRRNTLDYIEKKVKEYSHGNISNLSIALGDIDFFKRVNDHYGHECGDIVLKQLASLMRRKLEGQAQVGRWGGEEFLAVLPGVNGDEAATLMNEVLLDIRKMVIEYGEEKLNVTMTFGIAEYDIQGGIDATIKEADGKLYKGKESGRNQIVF